MTDYEKLTLNVRKMSLVFIGIDGWGDPVSVPVYAKLGSRAKIHYPTFFTNLDDFLAKKDDFGLEIALNDEKEREDFYEKFRKAEVAYAKYRKSIQLVKHTFELLASQEAEKDHATD